MIMRFSRPVSYGMVALLLTTSTVRAALVSGAPGVSEVTGGVVVYVGYEPMGSSGSPRENPNTCVQILDTDTKSVELARQAIRSQGRYGRVTADRFDGRRLPYVDNSINRLIMTEADSVSRREIERVLVPGGTALLAGKPWTKPRSENLDEWTHYLHNPSNNAVAQDTVVGPPRRLQWQGGPKWTRHHDRMSSFSAMVSTGGRIFYIIDEGSTASIYLPSHWRLVARDAFNGKVLWKRDIAAWYTRFKGLKDGPADAPRRLVAVGDRVFATLSLDGPVTCLDATSGRSLRSYPATKNTEELLVSGETLFVLIGPGSLGNGGRLVRPVEERRIQALHATTGKTLWQHTDVVAATTLAVDAKQAYYFNFDSGRVICLERATGTVQWRSPTLPSPPKQTSFFASKLVVHEGVVLFAGGEISGMTKSGGGAKRSDTLTALSTRTGDILWQAEHPPSGYSSPENLWVIDGTVWSDSSSNGTLDGSAVGLDLLTGEVQHRFPANEENYWFHHRCYAGRATTQYLMTSRTGIEFVDLESRQWDLNHWVRGACLYGIMPCNGLIYTPPAPCICYAESYLHSFNAFAPAATAALPAETDAQDRLFRGPAYQPMKELASRPGHPEDWPTYRGDNTRSGTSSTTLSPRMKPRWQTPQLGDKLSSPTVADGRIYVAAIDSHTVHALDTNSGSPLWQFTAGARVDSPPTHDRGRILFGSADGHVYCLQARTGTLVWRFQAAPLDRRLLAYEQMESVWPVHGSILVQDGIAHFVAGRSLFVDTGMRYYRLDVTSGRVLSCTVLNDRHPETGASIQDSVKWLNMPVGRPDIMSCDGQRIHMRSQAFDLEGNRLNMEIKTNGPRLGTYQEDPNKHLFCPTGFLDDTWFHRTYWLYGSTWGSGWCGYYIAGKFAPAGKIMSVGDDHVYSFGRQPEYYKWTLPLEYRLFAARKQWRASPDAPPANTKKNNRNRVPGPYPIDNTDNYAWSRDLPILARAMTATQGALVVAGPRDVLPENSRNKDNETLIRQQEAAFQGQEGAALWVIDAQDGRTLAEHRLASPPVFDGLAAARNRLYISMMDGTLACWE